MGSHAAAEGAGSECGCGRCTVQRLHLQKHKKTSVRGTQPRSAGHSIVLSSLLRTPRCWRPWPRGRFGMWLRPVNGKTRTAAGPAAYRQDVACLQQPLQSTRLHNPLYKSDRLQWQNTASTGPGCLYWRQSLSTYTLSGSPHLPAALKVMWKIQEIGWIKRSFAKITKIRLKSLNMKSSNKPSVTFILVTSRWIRNRYPPVIESTVLAKDELVVDRRTGQVAPTLGSALSSNLLTQHSFCIV